MFKNKAPNGKNNLCGRNVSKLRAAMGEDVSQRVLAEKLQLVGVDLGKNAIQKIESGERYVTDVELVGLTKVFGVTLEELLKSEEDE